MSTMREAADELAKHRKLLEGVLSLVNAADAAASLEGAVGERALALEQLNGSVLAKRQELDEVQGSISEAASTAKQLVKDAKAKASDVLDKAAEVQAEAAAAAAAVVAAAEAQASEYRAGLKAVQDQATAAQAQLDDINARIARAKSKMAELLSAGA